MIEHHGLDELIIKLDRMTENLNGEETIEMNEYRAMKFRDYLIQQMRADGLGLEPIKDPSHPPLYDSGELANHSNIKRGEGTNVLVGYFSSDSGRPHGSKITYTQIAILQTHGYRAGKTRVVPRPFLYIAARMFQDEGQDKKAVREYTSRKK